MEKDVEERFVNLYIVKSKRMRILHEFFHNEKRRYAIGRFCHMTTNYVKENCILDSGNKLSQEELFELMRKNNQKKCYVISWDSDIDGTWLNLEAALEAAIGLGMPSILIFDDFAIIETEQEQGAACKYVLSSTSG